MQNHKNLQDNNENKFWFKFKKVGGFVLSGFGLLFGEGTLENLKFQDKSGWRIWNLFKFFRKMILVLAPLVLAGVVAAAIGMALPGFFIVLAGLVGSGIVRFKINTIHKNTKTISEEAIAKCSKDSFKDIFTPALNKEKIKLQKMQSAKQTHKERKNNRAVWGWYVLAAVVGMFLLGFIGIPLALFACHGLRKLYHTKKYENLKMRCKTTRKRIETAEDLVAENINKDPAINIAAQCIVDKNFAKEVGLKTDLATQINIYHLDNNKCPEKLNKLVNGINRDLKLPNKQSDNKNKSNPPQISDYRSHSESINNINSSFDSFIKNSRTSQRGQNL